MKISRKTTVAVLIVLFVYMFTSKASLTAHAGSISADDGLMEIVTRVMEDFETLIALHEILEVLSFEERNSVGSRLMVSMQSAQIVRQQVLSLSEGRLFLWDARKRHEFNYEVSLSLEGFMHGQRNPPQNNLQIGFAGNGGDHGCGPISVHNNLYSLYISGIINDVPCIAGIIHRLDISGGFIMGGEIGTNPEAIVQLLRNMGHETNISYLPTDLDASIRQSAAGTAILLYIGQAAPGRPAYWHYITVRYAGGRFRLYNVGGNDRAPRFANSVDEWARNRAVLALITIS